MSTLSAFEFQQEVAKHATRVAWQTADKYQMTPEDVHDLANAIHIYGEEWLALNPGKGNEDGFDAAVYQMIHDWLDGRNIGPKQV